jgi:Protein of unknown function (DUF4239)
MIVDWVSNNPTWLWGSIFVALTTLIACLGLLIVNRLVNVKSRKAHNEAAGAFMTVIGTAYAVLVAFLAVAAWQAFTDAGKATTAEANFIGNLYEDTAGLHDVQAQSIRNDVKLYLDQVIKEEWPTQRRGEIVRVARPTLRRIHQTIAEINPTTPGEAVVQAELLRTMNDLYNARRERQLAAQGAIPPVVWWIIALGTAITVFYTYLFGVDDRRMHLVMTGTTMAALALVIVLIVSLDRPFRGDLSIGTDAYDNMRGALIAGEEASH